MSGGQFGIENSERVLVAGLVWLTDFPIPFEEDRKMILSGPAIGTALGIYALGFRPQFLVSIPYSVSQFSKRWLAALDPTSNLVRYQNDQPLRWTADSIIGETSKWRMEGDPRKWTPPYPHELITNRIVAFANGNLTSYSKMLQPRVHRFAAMDVDGRWAASRMNDLRVCLRHVDLVTLTRRDFSLLPKAVLAGTRLGQSDGAALVIKAGSDGIKIVAAGQSRLLPAPILNSQLLTDIGAGDVLLGMLTAKLGFSKSISIEDLEAAYMASTSTLSKLLTSRNFNDFADTILGL